jgi:ankyrin repeat protein
VRAQHDLATPLLNACEDGDEEVVLGLLKMGADANERGDKGVTGLMTAASWGHAEVCRILIAHGADVTLADDNGDTALHEAARADEMDVVDLLCETPGVDVNVKNKLECTPLHVASHAGHGQMVKLLIRLGACVNGPKGEMRGGYSALHVAAANGSNSSLSALLESGANIRHSASETNMLHHARSGSATALELAEAHGQHEATRLLRRASQQEFDRSGLFGPE